MASVDKSLCWSDQLQKLQGCSEKGRSNRSQRRGLGTLHWQWSESEWIALWSFTCQSTTCWRQYLERYRFQKEHQSCWRRSTPHFCRSRSFQTWPKALLTTQKYPGSFLSFPSRRWLCIGYVIHCWISAYAHRWRIHRFQVLCKHDESLLDVQFLLLWHA